MTESEREHRMAPLDRAECYDIARDTNWTPTYVTEDELFLKEPQWPIKLERE